MKRFVLFFGLLLFTHDLTDSMEVGDVRQKITVQVCTDSIGSDFTLFKAQNKNKVVIFKSVHCFST